MKTTLEHGDSAVSGARAPFRFKQFEVNDAQCGMRVGTDAVLLGALAPVQGQRMLDIGTGSGVVALMLAQRAEARVVGVEIDALAAHEAGLNFTASPWSDRLEAVCADITQYRPAELFDVIVSNPPYYRHSPASGTKERGMARQQGALTFAQLAEAAARLLAPAGRFAVVLPADGVAEMEYLCWEKGLYVSHRTLIRTAASKPVSRVVIVFSRQNVRPLENQLQLINADGSRTDDYARLTEDFYIR